MKASRIFQHAAASGLFLFVCGSATGHPGPRPSLAGGNIAPICTSAPMTPLQIAGPGVVADSEAVVGTWSDGKNTFDFTAKGDYVFKHQIPSGLGNGPVVQEAGTYQLRGTRIYLNPPTGNDKVLQFTFQGQQDTLVLTDGNNTYTLSKH